MDGAIGQQPVDQTLYVLHAVWADRAFVQQRAAQMTTVARPGRLSGPLLTQKAAGCRALPQPTLAHAGNFPGWNRAFCPFVHGQHIAQRSKRPLICQKRASQFGKFTLRLGSSSPNLTNVPQKPHFGGYFSYPIGEAVQVKTFLVAKRNNLLTLLSDK